MRKNRTLALFTFFVLGLSLAPNLFASAEIAYDSGKRRDPFVPLTGEENVSANVTASGIRLEGIIYDPSERSMAILNGKTYLSGESVGDAKVLKILKDHVVIAVDGEEKTLWIRQEEKTQVL